MTATPSVAAAAATADPGRRPASVFDVDPRRLGRGMDRLMVALQFAELLLASAPESDPPTTGSG